MALKVGPPLIAVAAQEQVKALRNKQKPLREGLNALEDKKEKETADLKTELKDIKKQIAVLTKNDQRSSFDSELALVLAGDYSLTGWIANPYFIGFKSQKLPIDRQEVLLDGRLSLAEVYAFSKPFWSWQMVLFGDPLYRLFMG